VALVVGECAPEDSLATAPLSPIVIACIVVPIVYVAFFSFLGHGLSFLHFLLQFVFRLLAVVIVAVIFVVPSIRERVFPFMGRVAFRSAENSYRRSV